MFKNNTKNVFRFSFHSVVVQSTPFNIYDIMLIMKPMKPMKPNEDEWTETGGSGKAGEKRRSGNSNKIGGLDTK